MIDALEKFAADYPGLLALIGATTAVAGLFATPAGQMVRRALHARQPDPKLSDPPSGDRGLARYSTQAVELLGREGALPRLQEFLRCKRDFAWMQIAGAGGQGKSRLGFELTLWARDNDWQAGLVETSDLSIYKARWPDWQPKKPHLLVLDYVIGREADIKSAIQGMAARARRLRKPVRMLLLERQRWDRGGLGAAAASSTASMNSGSEGRAEWFLALADRFDGNDPCLESSRFEDGVLELERLAENDLVSIVRRISALEGTATTLSDSVIAERLRQFDGAGRPLYAYFLGQVLAAGASVGPAWTRYDLLDAALDRDQGSRWRAALGNATPNPGDGSLAERLAVIATIAGGLDCSAAERIDLIPHADTQTRRNALILTDAAIGRAGGGPSRIIPSLQPDLLGEWFVLRSIRHGLPLEDALDPAWRLNPDQTAAFLNRLAQDFPKDPTTAELLDRKPPDDTANAALVKVAPTIVRSLHRTEGVLPQNIIDALRQAAAQSDARAMASLGWLLWAGRGMNRDADEAFNWWRKGAEAGNGTSMNNLALCYEWGIGVEVDADRALTWYRKGAEAGDGSAMANLATRYATGRGVELDRNEALAWYRKGAETGDGRAMTQLGTWLLDNGSGNAPDYPQAVTWYRKGAEAGDGGAMGFLGYCYSHGHGVEKDQGQAVSWFRRGAEVGDGESMSNLGLCYVSGNGVEQDFGTAVTWFRKGAEAGSGAAAANLGIRYEKGEGVDRDLEQAATWYRKGADAGNESAMDFLANCYEKGQGVGQDWDLALAWYRKGAEAGSSRASVGARKLAAAQALLAGGSEPKPSTTLWAERMANALSGGPWLDSPLVQGDWGDLTGSAAQDVLIRLRPAFELFLPEGEVNALAFERLRTMDLAFYPDCVLAEVQLRRPGQEQAEFVSALVSKIGAALLDGNSPLLHTINSRLLVLGDTSVVEAYLRFFCMFVHSDDEPFQVVEDLESLPFEPGDHSAILATLREGFVPPHSTDERRAADDWQGFEACILYTNAIFRSQLRVLSTGMVTMQEDKALAEDLPIRRRIYRGIFRGSLPN